MSGFPAVSNPLDNIPPLDYGTLVQVLHAAQQPEEATRKPAEHMMKLWEPLAEYPSSLYTVVGDEGVAEHSRVLAAVCLKNCLSKFWRRKLGSGGLSDQDKGRLREQLIRELNIGPPNIAKQAYAGFNIITDAVNPYFDRCVAKELGNIKEI